VRMLKGKLRQSEHAEDQPSGVVCPGKGSSAR